MNAKDTAKKVGKAVFLTSIYNQRNMSSIGLVLLLALLYVMLGGKITFVPIDKSSADRISQEQVQSVVSRTTSNFVAKPTSTTVKEEKVEEKESEDSNDRLKRLRERLRGN